MENIIKAERLGAEDGSLIFTEGNEGNEGEPHKCGVRNAEFEDF
jgi:hypothetical protein